MSIEPEELRSRWSHIESGYGTLQAIRQRRANATPETELRRNIERFKREQGCVVRSLEHALGVEATDEEWLMRAVQVIDVGDTFVEYFDRKQNGYSGDFTQFIQEENEKEWQRILGLVREISNHDTSLGRALAQCEIVGCHNVTIEQVQSLISEGRIILYVTYITYPSKQHPGNNEIGRHMAHIAIADSGNITFLSDQGVQQARPDEEEQLDIIILNRKT